MARPRRLTAARSKVRVRPGPGHTASAETAPRGPLSARLDDFSAGYLVGLLAGEGHFGGDGRQPQVTLRMHVRHEKIFLWLAATFPEARLYGPYHHGGRHYYQWMARGAFLREVLAPLVASRLDRLDDYVAERFRTMCARYGMRPEAPRAESVAP